MKLFLLALILAMLALASAHNVTMTASTSEHAKPMKPTTMMPIPTVDHAEKCDLKDPNSAMCCNLYTRCLSDCKSNGNPTAECAQICPEKSCQAKFKFIRGRFARCDESIRTDVEAVQRRVPHELVRQDRVGRYGDGDGDSDESEALRWKMRMRSDDTKWTMGSQDKPGWETKIGICILNPECLRYTSSDKRSG